MQWACTVPPYLSHPCQTGTIMVCESLKSCDLHVTLDAVLDSIYTERYMLSPDDNQDYYNVSLAGTEMWWDLSSSLSPSLFLQSSSLLPEAKELANVDYLLIHGTGDGRSRGI